MDIISIGNQITVAVRTCIVVGEVVISKKVIEQVTSKYDLVINPQFTLIYYVRLAL